MSYHARIMNIPTDTESMSSYPPGGVSLRAYMAGHRDARHAAAVIALEAQAEVERRDLAYEDLKREYDHKCERVDTLQARVRELEADPRLKLPREHLLWAADHAELPVPPAPGGPTLDDVQMAIEALVDTMPSALPGVGPGRRVAIARLRAALATAEKEGT